jgi:hypothetical protein
VWLVGVVGSAIGSAVTVFVTGLVNPLLDPGALLDQLSSGPPIHVVSVLRYADQGWVFDNPLTDPQVAQYDDLSFTPSSSEEYMEAIGGWPRDYEEVALVLQSKRAKPVQILDLQPKVDGCHASPTSTLVLTRPEGGDSDPRLGVDLDDPRPSFIDTSVPKGESRSYFARHSMTLAPDQVLSVAIDAYAFDRACEWRVEADVLVDGKKESFLLDTGAPFRVAGGSAAYGKVFAAKYLWPDAVQAGEGHYFGPASTQKLCRPDCRFPLAKTPF